MASRGSDSSNWRDRSSNDVRSPGSQNGRFNRDSHGRSNEEHPSRQERSSSQSPQMDILFFYNSSKKATNGQSAKIVPRSACSDATFVQNVRFDKIADEQRNRRIKQESVYRIFKDFYARGKNYSTAIRISHPKYGLTHLTQLALEQEDTASALSITGSESEGVVMNNASLNDLLREAHEAGVQGAAFDEFLLMKQAEFQEELPSGIHFLNKEHHEEASAAEIEIPKMGIVTAVYEFQDFVYELMAAMFDEVYANVTSSKSFERLCQRKDRRTSSSSSHCPNLLERWLSKSSNITAEIQEEFDSCSHEGGTINPSEYTAQQRYEIMKANPDKFKCTVKTIAAEYKDRCLETLRVAIPTMHSIGRVVEQLLNPNHNNENQSSQTFVNVLNHLVQNSEDYFGVIMSVNYNPRQPRLFVNFLLKNENVLNTVFSPAADEDDWCVRFEINNKKYCVDLNEKLNRVIRASYRDFDGWWLWIDENTRYVVKVGDSETMDHLFRLFVCIKTVVAQGRSVRGNEELETIPARINLIALKETINPTGEKDNPYYIRLLQPDEADIAASKCENYLVQLWREVLEKGSVFPVNYYLYYTCLTFFNYVADHIGKTVSCCVWQQAERSASVNFAMDSRDLESISRECVTERR